jgi:hypothetical protein
MKMKVIGAKVKQGGELQFQVLLFALLVLSSSSPFSCRSWWMLVWLMRKGGS